MSAGVIKNESNRPRSSLVPMLRYLALIQPNPQIPILPTSVVNKRAGLVFLTPPPLCPVHGLPFHGWVHWSAGPPVWTGMKWTPYLLCRETFNTLKNLQILVLVSDFHSLLLSGSYCVVPTTLQISASRFVLNGFSTNCGLLPLSISTWCMGMSCDRNNLAATLCASLYASSFLLPVLPVEPNDAVRYLKDSHSAHGLRGRGVKQLERGALFLRGAESRCQGRLQW